MKKLNILLLSGIIVVFSCEKPGTTVSKLFIIQEIFHHEYNIDGVANFSYSNTGDLIKYEYSLNGNMVSYENFYYSENKMDSSEYFMRISGEFTVVSACHYSFDLNDKPDTLWVKNLDSQETWIYNYKNQRIDSIEYENIYNGGRDTIVGYYKILTDNYGNIVWRRQYVVTPGYSNDYLPEIYEFDNKTNPFQNSFQQDVIRYFSVNNPTKDLNYTYQYKYNSRGLPIKRFKTAIVNSYVMEDDLIYSE